MKSNKLYLVPTNPIECFIYQSKKYYKTNQGYCVSQWSNKYFNQYDFDAGLVIRISKKVYETAKSDLAAMKKALLGVSQKGEQLSLF